VEAGPDRAARIVMQQRKGVPPGSFHYLQNPINHATGPFDAMSHVSQCCRIDATGACGVSESGTINVARAVFNQPILGNVAVHAPPRRYYFGTGRRATPHGALLVHGS
jgi:hypothetical protein